MPVHLLVQWCMAAGKGSPILPRSLVQVVDEACLTGESDPIKKTTEEDPWCRSGTQVGGGRPGAPAAWQAQERDSAARVFLLDPFEVWSVCWIRLFHAASLQQPLSWAPLMITMQVSEGSGRLLVVAVGQQSEWGKTMALVGEAGDEDTPLQEKLGDMAAAIGKVGSTGCHAKGKKEAVCSLSALSSNQPVRGCKQLILAHTCVPFWPPGRPWCCSGFLHRSDDQVVCHMVQVRGV